MTGKFTLWLRDKWSRGEGEAEQLANNYRACFTTQAGHAVLKHMLDEIYCTCLESTDALALAAHNGKRLMVHEILDNIDLAENQLKNEQEEDTDGS